MLCQLPGEQLRGWSRGREVWEESGGEERARLRTKIRQERKGEKQWDKDQTSLKHSGPMCYPAVRLLSLNGGFIDLNIEDDELLSQSWFLLACGRVCMLNYSCLKETHLNLNAVFVWGVCVCVSESDSVSHPLDFSCILFSNFLKLSIQAQQGWFLERLC